MRFSAIAPSDIQKGTALLWRRTPLFENGEKPEDVIFVPTQALNPKWKIGNSYDVPGRYYTLEGEKIWTWEDRGPGRKTDISTGFFTFKNGTDSPYDLAPRHWRRRYLYNGLNSIIQKVLNPFRKKSRQYFDYELKDLWRRRERMSND